MTENDVGGPYEDREPGDEIDDVIPMEKEWQDLADRIHKKCQDGLNVIPKEEMDPGGEPPWDGKFSIDNPFKSRGTRIIYERTRQYYAQFGVDLNTGNRQAHDKARRKWQ